VLSSKFLGKVGTGCLKEERVLESWIVLSRRAADIEATVVMRLATMNETTTS
jgi:hypothetical protein